MTMFVCLSPTSTFDLHSTEGATVSHNAVGVEACHHSLWRSRMSSSLTTHQHTEGHVCAIEWYRD